MSIFSLPRDTPRLQTAVPNSNMPGFGQASFGVDARQAWAWLADGAVTLYRTPFQATSTRTASVVASSGEPPVRSVVARIGR